MANDTLKVSRLYKDLDLAFSANPLTSDVSKKIDANAVKQAIKILMLTNFYERPFAPQKGANLRGLLFEPMSANFASVIERTITDLIGNYEPRARIQSLIVTPNFDTNAYEVTLTFFIVGITRPQTLTANLKRLR